MIKHTCNFYCDGPRHGWFIHLPASKSEARNRAALKLILLAFDLRLVALRPALEGAVAQDGGLPYLALVAPMLYDEEEG